ncbi:hypothetical protein K435DRAFT_679713, partial [Dendrothele bispora CBS 962.96]
IPTFGRSVIWRFKNNVSEMRKFANRDFENVTACSIPVLEGLFPRGTEKIVLDLAFTSCKFFKTITAELGRHLRQFSKDSQNYIMMELPHEAQKREQHLKKKNQSKAKTNTANAHPHIRKFNNETIKTHALGDFVWAIKYFGMADGWETQIVRVY